MEIVLIKLYSMIKLVFKDKSQNTIWFHSYEKCKMDRFGIQITEKLNLEKGNHKD